MILKFFITPCPGPLPRPFAVPHAPRPGYLAETSLHTCRSLSATSPSPICPPAPSPHVSNASQAPEPSKSAPSGPLSAPPSPTVDRKKTHQTAPVQPGLHKCASYRYAVLPRKGQPFLGTARRSRGTWRRSRRDFRASAATSTFERPFKAPGWRPAVVLQILS